MNNVWVAILALLATAAQPAAAAQWRHSGGGRLDVQMQQRQRPDSGGLQRQQPREFRGPERDFRSPERGFRGPDRDYRNPDRVDRRDGRLTDEERRNLHRDLDRANREIYRGR